MNYVELKEYINSNKIDNLLKQIICNDDISNEKKRYLKLLDEAYNLYGDGDYHFISSPGRSEIGGNHTDHQHGHVVAAGLNIDNLCIVKANNSNIVNYLDKAFKPNKVDISDLTIHKDEVNTTEALIRGIAFKLNELGYKIGGFDGLCESRVLIGSGISSSACFEVMVVEIFNALFNNEAVNDVDRAVIGQFAENKFFGKPSGLMDQMAISVGGFVAIDFKDPNNPKIDNYDFSFSDYGYELLLINTKGDHADLSHEYAAVPNEIKEVARLLNVEYLADATKQDLYNNLKKIRDTIKNDRAILRAMHFYNEDNRAILEAKACKDKDINSLLKLMNESGRSSFEYLQNVYPASRPNFQSLALGLFLADDFLKGEGAHRVHGGGFDGTIQVVIPHDKIEDFKKIIEPVFGEDAILQVRVRSFGTKLVV